MNSTDIIQRSAKFVQSFMHNPEAGHDWWHIQRVWSLSKTIASREECNPLIVELGALFHDIADTKFHDGKEEDGGEICAVFLRSLQLPEQLIKEVVYVVNHISFRKSLSEQVHMNPELAVVMDADRLDAMGAIGIARAFSFGAHKNRPFYDPSIPPIQHISTEEYKQRNSPTINHFYEKLLLLKDKMNTATGRLMANERHAFMQMYLEQFYNEWDGVS